MALNRLPLVPEDLRKQPAEASRSLARAAIAVSRAALDPTRITPPGFISRQWPDDRSALLFTRAAIDPMPLVPGGPLAQISYHFIASLQGVSAAAALIAKSLALSWDGVAQISVPALRLPHAAFVAQGAPIPSIVGLSSSGLLMAPYKVGVIVELTGEIIRYSNGEQMVEQVLRENVGPTLDSLLFSNVAGVVDQQPPGLLYGITALTPATAEANKFDAMVADLQTLAAAVAPVASGSIAFVCAVPQALAIQMRGRKSDGASPAVERIGAGYGDLHRLAGIGDGGRGSFNRSVGQCRDP